MTTIRVLSSLALASTLDALRPALAAAGLAVEATLLPTALLLPRIREGERADAAILTAEGVQALVDERILVSRRDLARSNVGIAVRHGAPKPPIGTMEELVEALHAARSIGLSRAGASGLFFAGLLDRLGLTEMVQAKATVIESGYTAALAADGRVELAVQQISELLMVPGIDLVGPLPAACGGESMFSGGVFAATAAPEAAGALLAHVASAQDVLRACGLAPA